MIAILIKVQDCIHIWQFEYKVKHYTHQQILKYKEAQTIHLHVEKCVAHAIEKFIGNEIISISIETSTYIIQILIHSLHFIHSFHNNFLIYIFLWFCETFILKLHGRYNKIYSIIWKYSFVWRNNSCIVQILKKNASIILQIFGAERIFTKILLLTKFNEPSLNVYGSVIVLIVRKIEFIAVSLCCFWKAVIRVSLISE